MRWLLSDNEEEVITNENIDIDITTELASAFGSISIKSKPSKISSPRRLPAR
jgi:hypothetical protein